MAAEKAKMLAAKWAGHLVVRKAVQKEPQLVEMWVVMTVDSRENRRVAEMVEM